MNESDPKSPALKRRLSWKRISYYLVGALLLMYVGSFGWQASLGPAIQTRNRLARVGADMRALATGLERVKRKTGEYPPGGEYFGYFDQGLRSLAPAKDSDGIDPFNQMAPKSQWRGNYYMKGPDGGWAKIHGGDYHYMTDGKAFWALISLGPDSDLDITEPIINSAFQKTADDYKEMREELNPHLYDPTNGTASGGDIMRTKDPD